MTPDQPHPGVWECRLSGDQDGAEYTYTLVFEAGGSGTESVDPYARAVTANGQRGVVVNVDKLLGQATRMPSFGSASDAIIYELHVRDLTIGPENGITHKGKFLGLTEAGTRTAAGNLSGLDYIASLGVTHVQLLPVFDFGSVDETGDLRFGAQYNWGYDPVHYNVPEGSYATDPTNPTSRIQEFRQLVDAFHARGIRVIMDVVYNHVYDAADSPLERTVPGYYFRMRPDGGFYNGTACGNETASEQLMMRKFIVDSITYWATTFGLDGFRFDLMGIHDVDTMNAVRAAVDDIDPGIILLGEGWDLGHHPDGVVPAHHGNSRLMPGVSSFNDFYRDIIKGSNFILSDPGFVSGCVGSYDVCNPMRGRYMTPCWARPRTGDSPPPPNLCSITRRMTIGPCLTSCAAPTHSCGRGNPISPNATFWPPAPNTLVGAWCSSMPARSFCAPKTGSKTPTAAPTP